MTTSLSVCNILITKLCKTQDSNKIQNFKNFSTYTTPISYHSIIGISMYRNIICHVWTYMYRNIIYVSGLYIVSYIVCARTRLSETAHTHKFNSIYCAQTYRDEAIFSVGKWRKMFFGLVKRTHFFAKCTVNQGRIKQWANWAVAPCPALGRDDLFLGSLLDFGRKIGHLRACGLFLLFTWFWAKTVNFTLVWPGLRNLLIRPCRERKVYLQ